VLQNCSAFAGDDDPNLLAIILDAGRIAEHAAIGSWRLTWRTRLMTPTA
jgi:hypothetical protein